MWPSVLSQGRSVPLPVPSISRMQRSPQDRNRLPPLARPIPPGSPHRSMSASTTRLAQYSTPLSLSIFARPHRMASCVPGELIPCAFVWHDPGITLCCKSRFALVIKNSPGCRRDFRVKMWGTSSTDDKLTRDLGNVIETTQIGGRRSDRLTAGKLSPGNFGLLQQYLPGSDIALALPGRRAKGVALPKSCQRDVPKY